MRLSVVDVLYQRIDRGLAASGIREGPSFGAEPGVAIPLHLLSEVPRGAVDDNDAGAVRDGVGHDLTGGAGGASPLYRLNIRLSATQLQIIVDINTARPDINNYGIDAVYTLTEIATGKPVTKGQTFARVSYNIPGQEQRFAGERGLRDAEDRAAKEISENIRNRLASHFAAGT